MYRLINTLSNPPSITIIIILWTQYLYLYFVFFYLYFFLQSHLSIMKLKYVANMMVRKINFENKTEFMTAKNKVINY